MNEKRNQLLAVVANPTHIKVQWKRAQSESVLRTRGYPERKCAQRESFLSAEVCSERECAQGRGGARVHTRVDGVPHRHEESSMWTQS
jgi:hypothetical protein